MLRDEVYRRRAFTPPGDRSIRLPFTVVAPGHTLTGCPPTGAFVIRADNEGKRP
jgi:hypothetical protein